MQAKRVDEYHKHGCHFSGKLAVVDYQDDLQNDPRWGQFGEGLTIAYAEKAAALLQEKYGKPVEVLLSVPEYVCRVE